MSSGLPSITPDIHLIDSTSYESQYSPFAVSKSLNRRSLHQSFSNPMTSSHVVDTFGANNLNEQKPNIIYGRRSGQVIYPGKHNYQIAPTGHEMPAPLRPPLPDHIYECIDDECYCFNAGQQRADYRTKKFYREFESPARKQRPPPLRSAVIAPAFRELSASSGSERNLLRTIAASVLNSSPQKPSANVCSDFLLDLSCASTADHLLSNVSNVSNEAMVETDSSDEECSSLDDNSSTDNANQRSSQQSMTSTGTEGQMASDPRLVVTRSAII